MCFIFFWFSFLDLDFFLELVLWFGGFFWVVFLFGAFSLLPYCNRVNKMLLYEIVFLEFSSNFHFALDYFNCLTTAKALLSYQPSFICKSKAQQRTHCYKENELHSRQTKYINSALIPLKFKDSEKADVVRAQCSSLLP